MNSESSASSGFYGRTTNKKLLWFTVAAILLLQIITLREHWDEVESMKPDFVAFYGTGRLVRTGGAPDYDPTKIKIGESKTADPSYDISTRTDTLHPPFESLVFAPLSFLPYKTAYIVWFGCNLLFLWSVPVLLWPYIPRLHAEFHFIAILVGSLLPVSICLIFGQDSLLLLLLMTMAYVSLERRQELRAGLLLGLGLFKFQLIVPIIALFFLTRAWKVIAGFLLAFALLMIASLSLVGATGTLRYVPYAFSYGKKISATIIDRTAQMPNLRGLVASVFGGSRWPALQTSITLLVSALIFAIVLRWAYANSSAPVSVRFALLVTMSSFLSYHYYVYNSVILILPLLLFANVLENSRVSSRYKFAFASVAICVYVVPILFSLEVGMLAVACSSFVLLMLLILYPQEVARVQLAR